MSSDGPDWVRDAVFYQIFPDRFANGDRTNDPPGTVPWSSAPTRDNFFGGDLAGILERLPYLEDLGVNALYLTPIFRAATNHRYDTHDYYAVDPAVGDTGLLREFVQEAHARGIRVMLDAVFNHVGEGFFAFEDLRRNGAQSAYRDWFVLRGDRAVSEPLSYQTCGGAPYLPKLDTTNPEVREYLLDVAAHWLVQADIDGWRADVPWKVPLDFWDAFRARVKSVMPDAYLVAEAWWSWGPLRHVFDGLMNYRLRNDLFDFCLFDRKDAEDLAIESRLLLAESSGGHHMLNLLGSHDTARIATLAEGDAERIEFALVALFTYPGAPMLYYGDELGLEGGDDPDCRRAMPWDEDAWNHRRRDLVRRLIELRRASVALRRGDWQPLLAFNRVLAFRRTHGDEQAIVVLNAGPERRDFALELPSGSPAGFVDALSGDAFACNGRTLALPVLRARSALVLVPQTARAQAGAVDSRTSSRGLNTR
jgi:cyclomaltodextrinase / maltogenic alpha-amylase / neopullulanase